MPNLGGYQVLTTVSKKIGGPGNLVGGLIGVGATIAAAICIPITKRITEKRIYKKMDMIIYTVNNDGKDTKGLEMRKGDQFRVLERDKDAILIEKIGDSNNPYFVSAEFLWGISDFR